MIRGKATKLLSGAAAAFDKAATLAVYAGSKRARAKSRAEGLGHAERLIALERLAALYPPDAPGFFRAPSVIEPEERLVRWVEGGRRVVDLTWSSEYQCFDAGISERYLHTRENAVAAARLLTAPRPRPVAVLVHGYMAGAYDIEQRLWPIEWLDRIGLDVAFFVLPFHGSRSGARPLGKPPLFPGSDPRMTNEGFRQAMADLADLVRWLLARGHPAVGVMGMSLGGYTTALAATVVEDLAFAVPLIPLACLADFAREQGRLGSTPEETELQHVALAKVHRVVSPLARAPLLPPERLLVIGAHADRITPVGHASRIAQHFAAPLESWHGGHLLQFGRADKFRRIGRMLDTLGLTTRARP